VGAVIELSGYSLIGALIFLVIGLAELAIMRRTVYPALRWRYEEAKTTQTHGIDPSRIMFLIRFQSLVFMPLVGLLLGGPVRSIFGDAQ
jgi:hypothetical protein